MNQLFSKTIFLKDFIDTEKKGAELALNAKAPMVIFLEGQLGAGKTTFVRGFLRGLGFQGTVKSPTFTLIETYDIADKFIVHADLYRLKDPHELEAVGFRDYFTPHGIILIEWASQAIDWLPKPELLCTLKMTPEEEGRLLQIDVVGPISKDMHQWLSNQ